MVRLILWFRFRSRFGLGCANERKSIKSEAAVCHLLLRQPWKPNLNTEPGFNQQRAVAAIVWNIISIHPSIHPPLYATLLRVPS